VGIGEEQLELLAVGRAARLLLDILFIYGPTVSLSEAPQVGQLIVGVLTFVFRGHAGIESNS
jgi:hypothetical protein